MKTVLLAALVAVMSSAALAQDASTPIPFTQDERQIMLRMCEAARWASRIQFDQMCEALKAKFEAADKAAEKPKDEKK